MKSEKSPSGKKTSFAMRLFLAGAFVFLTAPLLLLVQSKYKGVPRYSKESRQLRLHYLQSTLDVYSDRAKRGADYPEYSVMLIREFLHTGNTVSAEAWLRRGIFDWSNPALAEYYAQLIARGVLTVPHPKSFRLYLGKKAKEFREP